MELTIPPLFRLPHPFRNRRGRRAEAQPETTVSAAMIPRPRASNEQITARTVDALVKRG